MKKLLSLVVVFALAITMLSTNAFVVDTKAVFGEENVEENESATTKNVEEYNTTHTKDKKGKTVVATGGTKKRKNKVKQTSNSEEIYMAPYSGVRKQGKIKICWMFGTMASAESNLLKKAGYEGIEKNNESIDLSATLAKDDPINLSEGQAVYTLYNSEKYINEDGKEVAKTYSSNDVHKYQLGDDDENIGFRGSEPIDGAVALSADKGAALDSDNPHDLESIENMANRAKEKYNLNRFNLTSAEQLPEIYEQTNLNEAGDFDLDHDVMLEYDIHPEARDIWKSKIRENGAIYAKYYQCSKVENTIVPGMPSGLDLVGCFYHSWGDDTNYDSVRYQPNYWIFCHRTKVTAWQNHSIAIVGYDDGYSKYNFAQRYIINDNQTLDYDANIAKLEWVKEENGEPVRINDSTGRNLEFETSEYEKPGYAQYIVPINDGAWITKQSYDKKGDNGKRFHDGIMYVSYSDPSFVEANSIVVEESLDQILQGKKVYDDTFSHSSLMGGTVKDLNKNAKASEVFKIDHDTEINQVGYWTGKANTITNISVYKDVCGNNKSDSFNPENGELIATLNKTDDYVGYHTIKLPNREFVDKGSKVSVVISQECEGESALMLEANEYDIYQYNIGDTFINKGSNWVDSSKDKTLNVANTTVKLFGNSKSKYVAPYTSIKRQSPFGSCWMFAGIAAAESNLLTKAKYGQGKVKRDPIDLSEAQATYCHYNAEKDNSGNDLVYSSNDNRTLLSGKERYYGFLGGALLMDAAISLSAEKGSALESDNPFYSEKDYPNYFNMTKAERETPDENDEPDHRTPNEQVVADALDNKMVPKAKEQYNLNRFHLKSVERLPEIYSANENGDAEEADAIRDKNRNVWKNKIKNNGAIYSTFFQSQIAPNYHCWGEDEGIYARKSTMPNYWYYDSINQWSHVVAIVGYDDEYSKYNFAEKYETNKSFDSKIAQLEWVKEENGEPVRIDNSKGRNLKFETSEFERTGYAQYIVPKEDGAWLTKNSYGTTNNKGKQKFGEDGIEYMSYCEASFTEAVSLVVEESMSQINNDKKVYNTTLSHSSLMGVPITGLGKDAKASEIYTLDVDTEINQVGYWTGKEYTETTIEIRKDLTDPTNPESGTTVYRSSVLKPEFKGYHTVKLPNKLLMKGGSTISVIINQKCGNESALMLESDTDNYPGEYTFKCVTGDTFIKNDDDGNWVDPKTLSVGVNVGNSTVKLFGNEIEEEPDTSDQWKPIEYNESDEQYYWNDVTKNNITVTSKYVEQYFGNSEGLLVRTPKNISSISVNGRTENVAKIIGDNAVLYISAFNRYLNDVEITLANGETSYLEVKNKEGIRSDYYNVKDYIDGDNRSYPKKEGKIFAGWYEDDSCETPYTKTSGKAYAKFIDEDVLDTKFQWKEDDCGAVRFVSSVDSLDYEKVGFIINGTYGDHTITDKRRETTKAFRTIMADGKTINPSEAFCDSSQLFTTYTIRGLDENVQSSWEVRAYFVTLDGTMVMGKKGCNYRLQH